MRNTLFEGIILTYINYKDFTIQNYINSTFYMYNVQIRLGISYKDFNDNQSSVL